MIDINNITNVKKNKVGGVFDNTYQVTSSNSKIITVPKNEDNTDYQAILQWVDEGNTIQEAD
tara:strand:+ start:74 stop:259 length:186 start_codon:yes stop_codon:yes gene_type:complete